MATSILNIPLPDLRPGPKDVNSRKTASDIKGLAKSITEHGMLVPLIVRRTASSVGAVDKIIYEVVDGNRRLAALSSLYPKKEAASVVVPCLELGASHPKALELSMVVNIDREGLHPVDQFEVFASLVESGDTVEAIAKRYSMKTGQVRQALSLARLAQPVRDAWRAGDLDGDIVETFALTSDHKAQAAALKKAGKHPNAYQIRRALLGDGGADSHIGQLLAVVGRDEYEKAGHQVNETLFSDDERDSVTVSDFPALRKMADDKLAAKCEALIADGWKWAIPRSDAPNDVYAWKHIQPDGGRFTKEQMATLGCIVSLPSSGAAPDVARGYLKPGDKGVPTPKSPKQKKVEAKQREERKEETGGVSNALAFRLSKQLTLAMREAFATALKDGDVVAFAVAAVACSNSPMKISLGGDSPMVTERRHDNDFAKYYRLAAGKDPSQMFNMLAVWVGQSIDLTSHRAEDLVALLAPGKDDEKGPSIIAKAIGADELLKASRKHFDAADYFASVSKELIWQAVDEALGAEHSKRVAAMKATEAREYAIKHVPKTGWVPQALRIGKA